MHEFLIIAEIIVLRLEQKLFKLIFLKNTEIRYLMSISEVIIAF